MIAVEPYCAYDNELMVISKDASVDDMRTALHCRIEQCLGIIDTIIMQNIEGEGNVGHLLWVTHSMLKECKGLSERANT